MGTAWRSEPISNKNNIIEKQQTTADSEVATWDNISNPKILSNTNGISSNHHPRNGSLPLPTLVTTTAQNKSFSDGITIVETCISCRQQHQSSDGTIEENEISPTIPA